MHLSDSHCHLAHTGEMTDLSPIMQEMIARDFRFVMDIGTLPGDLQKRHNAVRQASGGIIPSFVHFAVGLWPHTELINNPEASLATLEADIQAELTRGSQFCGLGECGLDRYWNEATGILAEQGKAFAKAAEEEAFFIAQIKLAQKYGLAVIIHSRDAVKDTLRCIDAVGYHHGVMHCYSYGVEEVQAFIDRGWYISLSGTITFAKRDKKLKQAIQLIQSIPDNLLLVETDSPYLSPVPVRGKTNTPLHIEHTYAFVAKHRGISVAQLADLVYENCQKLFAIRSP